MKKTLPGRSLTLITKLCSLAFFIILFYGSKSAFAGFSLMPKDSFLRQFSYEINPGDEKTDYVHVENLSNEPLNLHFYSADATASNQGTFALTTTNIEQKNIGKWIIFKNPYLTIGSGKKKEIPFSIKIPADQPPGSYAGGIAAETGINPDQKQKPANAVNISSRIVVKMFINVRGGQSGQGGKTALLELGSFSYSAKDNPLPNRQPNTFYLGLQNSGNTILMLENKIEITPLLWGKKEILTSPGLTLFQKNTLAVPIAWPDQPAFGFFTAKAAVTAYQFDSSSNKKINPQTYGSTIIIKFIPWFTIFAIVCGMLLLLTVLMLARAKKQPPVPKVETP